VKVRVMSVDLQRNRIALTMKTSTPTDQNAGAKRTGNTSAARGAAKTPAAPVKPYVPKPGDVAPNGMRFR
jgi:transcriptional accessory protein Tex/SPT6